MTACHHHLPECCCAAADEGPSALCPHPRCQLRVGVEAARQRSNAAEARSAAAYDAVWTALEVAEERANRLAEAEEAAARADWEAAVARWEEEGE